MDQITASAEDRASVAAVLAALGPVAVVRIVPSVVVGTAGERRRSHVSLWDAYGADLTERVDADGHRIARDTVRAVFAGASDHAVDYHVCDGVLVPVTALRTPPEPRSGLVLPLSAAPLVPRPVSAQPAAPEMPGGAW